MSFTLFFIKTLSYLKISLIIMQNDEQLYLDRRRFIRVFSDTNLIFRLPQLVNCVPVFNVEFMSGFDSQLDQHPGSLYI